MPSSFQCHIFSDQSGVFHYTPNIPDPYFDHENLGVFSTNLTLPEVTYIFTLPPLSPERNCSGRVVALQYCYRANLERTSGQIGQTQKIFDFLSMSRDNFQFTVISTISIHSTPSNSICRAVVISGSIQFSCCDVTSLTIRQPAISESSFTFGIRTSRNSDIRPLAFAQPPHVKLFIAVGSQVSYILSEAHQFNGTLFLLRLIVGNYH